MAINTKNNDFCPFSPVQISEYPVQITEVLLNIICEGIAKGLSNNSGKLHTVHVHVLYLDCVCFQHTLLLSTYTLHCVGYCYQMMQIGSGQMFGIYEKVLIPF